MATGACKKNNLLAQFADNNAQLINAADMRLFVSCVYDNFLDITNVIDNLDTYISDKALSSRQGAILNDMIETNQQGIANLDADKIDANLVYPKSESDTRYYTQSYIDGSIYTKYDVYNKTEIDALWQNLYSSIQNLNDRIDNLVQKNNLEE